MRPQDTWINWDWSKYEVIIPGNLQDHVLDLRYHWIRLCKRNTHAPRTGKNNPKPESRLKKDESSLNPTQCSCHCGQQRLFLQLHQDLNQALKEDNSLYRRSATDADNSHIPDHDWGTQIPVCHTINCFSLVSRLSIFTLQLVLVFDKV